MDDSDYHGRNEEARLPQLTAGEYSSAGTGYKAWETRRANAFLKAVRGFRRLASNLQTSAEAPRAPGPVDAARQLSQYLLRTLPAAAAHVEPRDHEKDRDDDDEHDVLHRNRRASIPVTR